ncbi:enoyl-CoA hydratase-related protein [Brevibacterium paucivorans]|uniref:enoyl-CoA hydratase-related protein n=1 Tax=Brevibacterium paucivorans TaxID=170994 RepID=UPI0025CC29B1|nr:enoyl-CoA hydratase-related protein [uncultured Brevibacterium sp.]
MSQGVLTDLTDGILTIQFNRPEAMNALHLDAFLTLEATLADLSPEVQAIIVKGNERAFCSGADVSLMSPGQGSLGMEKITQLMQTYRDVEVPVIAAVSGPAAGIGCSLALMADYVLMSEKSYLMLAFTRIGLMPDGGATALVAASAGRHRALRMALTAEKLPATSALEWGLASEVVAPDLLDTRASEIAATFAKSATVALGRTKRAINDATLTELDAALGREATGQDALRQTEDYAEGVAAFLEKRPAVFKGVNRA